MELQYKYELSIPYIQKTGEIRVTSAMLEKV